jgi:hypothetical protein
MQFLSHAQMQRILFEARSENTEKQIGPTCNNNRERGNETPIFLFYHIEYIV